MLVHGAGVRANIFRPPTQRTLVDALIADGYDVWLENWRASIDVAPNEWTLDQAALHDHPRAVETILRETGGRQVKAIVHCQGAMSFVLAAIAGLLPQVPLVISNAVSLHPVMPPAARRKLRHLIPLLSRLTPYLDPQWGLHPKGLLPRLLTLLTRAIHTECDNTVCRMASQIYGVGHPTLWRHENLHEGTHAWLTYEFAHVPLSFFEQILQSVEAGHLVTTGRFPELPRDIELRAPRSDARFVFLTGRVNHCFEAESLSLIHI